VSVLVGKPAPDFTAAAVLADGTIADKFTLSEEIKGKYGLVFFYPLDFTFVCPSEILAFNRKVEEFNKKNCHLIGVSVDSHFTHLAWKNVPRTEGGLGDIGYPMLADLNKKIATDYGVLLDAGIALRGLFLIDKSGTVQHAVINNLPLGRNVDEALRMVDALQFHEKNGEVCPANWTEGDKGMKADPKGSKEYFSVTYGS